MLITLYGLMVVMHNNQIIELGNLYPKRKSIELSMFFSELMEIKNRLAS